MTSQKISSAEKEQLKRELQAKLTVITVITAKERQVTILPKDRVEEYTRKAVRAGHRVVHRGGIEYEKDSLYIDSPGTSAEDAKLFRYIEERNFVIISDNRNKTETICETATFKPIEAGKYSIGGIPIPPIKSTVTAIVPVRS